MHDEISERSVTLAVRTSRMTGKVLFKALQKYLREQMAAQEKSLAPESYRGKMSVKEMMKDKAALSSIEIHDKNIKGFERVARKYGIEYALKKDSSKNPPQYLVFFKGKDADVLDMAFREFVQKRMKKKERPSVKEKLQELKAKHKKQAKERPDKQLDKVKDRLKKREVIR